MGDQVHDRSILGELYMYIFLIGWLKSLKVMPSLVSLDHKRVGIFDYIE